VPTEPAPAVDSSHPGNADASANLQRAIDVCYAGYRDDFTNDLMARNQLVLESRQITLDDMQVRSTDPASEHAK
jgi:hypothetical protein